MDIDSETQDDLAVGCGLFLGLVGLWVAAVVVWVATMAFAVWVIASVLKAVL